MFAISFKRSKNQVHIRRHIVPMMIFQISSSDRKVTKRAGQMRARLMEHFKTMVEAVNPPSSRAADPRDCGKT